jgi:UDP-N-acetylmuramate dehydrogenase
MVGKLEKPTWISENVVLAPYTSWQIGGPTQFFAAPSDFQMLKDCYAWALNQRLKVTLLSGGSNVLVSDQGIRGLVICFKNYKKIEVKEMNNFLYLYCEPGVPKSELLKTFLKYKLDPALFLAGIPGDVAGGVVMNAGVSENFQPREFCEIVEEISVLKPDLSTQTYKNSDLSWSYRHSKNWEPGIIFSIKIKWPLIANTEILSEVKKANQVRLQKQPLDKPSCGSVFVNPTGYKSAQLIDQCGLKGFRIGDAQVSEKHANFIVNLGSATAHDTISVIKHVQEKVLEKFAVTLKTEVVLLGFD